MNPISKAEINHKHNKIVIIITFLQMYQIQLLNEKNKYND